MFHKFTASYPTILLDSIDNDVFLQSAFCLAELLILGS